jgi:hypothetical protein
MLHQFDEFQKRVNLLNKQEQLEDRSYPFFVIAWVIVALFVCGEIYSDYKSEQDHAAMSSMVAQCANGKAVQFGDSVMRCKVSEMVAQR